MANSLTNILDKILAQGLSTLREAAVMPRLTRTMTGQEAAQKGSTIDIPVPKSQTVADVSAGNTLVSAADKTPGLVQLAMANWKKTDFYLTDKEMVEIDRNRHFIPMQTAEAARAMGNNLDTTIHNEYLGIYGYVGTAGTVPFSTVATATNARKVLNNQLAPMEMRNIVMDPDAEGQALQLAAYSDVEKTQDRAVKIEGEIGRKFGFDHFMSQNVVTHTKGTATSIAVGSTTAAGASSIDIKSSAGSLGTLVTGDIFTIAGDTQTYVVTKATTTLTSAGVAITIDPALKAIASASKVITLKASHVVNLAFHPNAFVWATRPLEEATSGINPNPTRVMTDPVSGVTMRLEVIRQNKRAVYEFDFLHGAQLVRPELAARIAG